MRRNKLGGIDDLLAGFVLIAVVVPVRCMPSGEMGYQCATLYGRNGRRRKVEAKWFVKKKKREKLKEANRAIVAGPVRKRNATWTKVDYLPQHWAATNPGGRSCQKMMFRQSCLTRKWPYEYDSTGGENLAERLSR